ncbi:hypothetical protein [Methylosinus sp. Sm6]|uniref:hypothetical protein n=1 Tax=Methylosinus sp. Sm6 TaxID=2866948 RepID=UPI001C9938B9|nr:hypothetical protein [Methylosinus sp. Sm6]MBY6240142.1 hypothetical protein [Methylosinus sp. Sm6]
MTRQARRESAARTPLRAQRATLSTAQIMRAALLLAAGLVCAAGVHVGAAKAQAARSAETPGACLVGKSQPIKSESSPA